MKSSFSISSIDAKYISCLSIYEYIPLYYTHIVACVTFEHPLNTNILQLNRLLAHLFVEKKALKQALPHFHSAQRTNYIERLFSCKIMIGLIDDSGLWEHIRYFTGMENVARTSYSQRPRRKHLTLLKMRCIVAFNYMYHIHRRILFFFLLTQPEFECSYQLYTHSLNILLKMFTVFLRLQLWLRTINGSEKCGMWKRTI